MNSFRCHRQSWSAPGQLSLAFVLVLLGFAGAACKKAEPPAEVAPAETATTAPAAEATPLAGAEITIKGFMPPRWDQPEVNVGPGDTIVWQIGGGPHGLRFPVKADCELALATMTFDPPLDPIAGGGCQSKPKKVTDEVIVTARVTAALTRDLPYDCVIHRSVMPGVLKPK